MDEGFFIQVIEAPDSPFNVLLERFPEGFPAMMLADQISGRNYPARFKRAKSGDIFWLLDRQKLRLDQWVALDILHGQWLECVWVDWELFAEPPGEVNSEESIYPLLVELPNIPIILFGASFGISERWVEKDDPRIQQMIQVQRTQHSIKEMRPMQW